MGPESTLTHAPAMKAPRGKRARKKGLVNSKSGCRTCKIRRVKCGEERPNCLRCIKFGTTCEWDSVERKVPALNWPAPTPLKLVPKGTNIAPRPANLPKKRQPILLPRINLLVPLLANPSKELFHNDEERRYFDIFASKTAFEILPSFDSGTLRQILLQACVSDASIRHAIVALGALDKTAESFEVFGSSPLVQGRQEAFLHHQNALKQYTTAIHHMREASSSRQDLRTTLLSCLVIFCFEAWDGLKQNAVKQIQTGLRLIRIWREQQAGSHRVLDVPLDSTEVIEEDLVRAFSRLDVQAISFAPDEDSQERHAIAWIQETAILDRMPQVFSSVQEAEIYESAIMRRSMRFLSFKIPLPKPTRPLIMFPVNGWYGVTAPSVVTIQQSILTQISRWEIAFLPLSRRLKGRNDPNLMIATMLSMHIKSVFVALRQVCMESEDMWDDYQPLFTDLVELAEYTTNGLNTLTSSTPKFQFDSHTVIPLMMVGHKCREPRLRRRAINLLLRNPRREGVWDSVAAGTCAAWAMEIEEENLQMGRVPAWARIHGVMLEPDSQLPRRGTFTCHQRLDSISEDIVTRRKNIIW